jgi:hypothetical protein
LAPLAPRQPRIFWKQDHALNTGGLTISWLEALKNLDTETTQETEIATDAATEFSESLIQQGAKSAERGDEGLLALLALPHIRNSEFRISREKCPVKANPTRERHWLDALTGLEGRGTTEEKRRANAMPSAVDEISESLVHRGDKSAKSPTPSPDGEETSNVNATEVEPQQARRTLVTTQDRLAEVIADLEDESLVALDLETP